MNSATHMVRVAVLVGMVAGGAAQAHAASEGETRTSSGVVETTMRARVESDRYAQGGEDLRSRDRSLRGDDRHDDIVGDQVAAIHVGLGELAELGLVLHVLAEHVARRDVQELRGGSDALRLGALSRPGRSKQHDIH